MSRFNLFFWSITLLFCYTTFSIKAQVYEKTAELHGDIVVFPITLVNVYPLISGTVNCVSGKFMFDTGSEHPLVSTIISSISLTKK